ncbi:unnamed protein product [Phytomonas sp. EM1]|nr:unnamed protein product [Phytomonas sp. EM1]|eukprot:CCW64150.1 unnamed protein product [Phytomonas sp. isolate EM1]
MHEGVKVKPQAPKSSTNRIYIIPKFQLCFQMRLSPRVIGRFQALCDILPRLQTQVELDEPISKRQKKTGRQTIRQLST